MTIINRHLTVEGMHCPGCEDTIRLALADLPGVITLDVSYARATVDVQFDDQLADEAAIDQAIRAKGYGVALTPRPAAGKLKGLLIFLLLLLAVGGVTFWGKSLMPGVMQQITAHGPSGIVGYRFSHRFSLYRYVRWFCGGLHRSPSNQVPPAAGAF